MFIVLLAVLFLNFIYLFTLLLATSLVLADAEFRLLGEF